MNCPKCGAENIESAELCRVCSWVLAGTSTSLENDDAKNSPLAVAALVLAILGFVTFGITLLPAIICGIAALVKIEKSQGQFKGKKFAIASLAVPVILIPLAIFAAVLLPSLSKTRKIAERVITQTNIKIVCMSMFQYSGNYDGEYPTGERWCDLLIQETGLNRESLVSSNRETYGQCYYVVNKNILDLGMKESPSDMVMIFETSEPGWNMVGTQEMIGSSVPGIDGCNVGFADGHIEYVPQERFYQLRWIK